MTEESTVPVNLGRLYLEGAGISEGAEGPELGQASVERLDQEEEQ